MVRMLSFGFETCITANSPLVSRMINDTLPNANHSVTSFCKVIAQGWSPQWLASTSRHLEDKIGLEDPWPWPWPWRPQHIPVIAYNFSCLTVYDRQE